MTSLVAQNQFGTLIDASQRQPVTVTRHGRPVAVVMSYEDYQASLQTITPQVAALISEAYPLRGTAAGDAADALPGDIRQRDSGLRGCDR